MKLSMKTDAEFRLQEGLSLGLKEAHVWQVDISAMTPCIGRLISILSGDERKRTARFYRDLDRNRFVITRALLRQILGSYLGKEPENLTFGHMGKDKPVLGDESARGGISFNVSHSGNIALLAFARSREVGVDVEQIRADVDAKAIAKRFFSMAEKEQLAALPEQERTRGFFRCWTRKESFIKAIGEGLSLPLDQFDVSLESNPGNALLATRPDPAEQTRWTLRDISVNSEYAAALCVSGTDWQLIEQNPQELCQ